MEWMYYTNHAKRRKIDSLLASAASLFANCDSTYSARQEAKYKEQEILAEIASIDPFFAERCGYLQKDNWATRSD